MKLVTRVRKRFKSIINNLYRHNEQKISNLIYPKVNDTGLRIHLGAGSINIQGWINIDARDDKHIHLQTNNFDLKEFAPGGVSEIYMCHVLEHFSFNELVAILKTLQVKLKVNGVLRLSVPDFDQLIVIYQETGRDLELIKRALMGGQEYEYNFHKSVFNKTMLSDLLMTCGFINIQCWDTQDDFGVDLNDWSNKGFATPIGNIPVSLNLKAMKA